MASRYPDCLLSQAITGVRYCPGITGIAQYAIRQRLNVISSETRGGGGGLVEIRD